MKKYKPDLQIYDNKKTNEFDIYVNIGCALIPKEYLASFKTLDECNKFIDDWYENNQS